MDWQTFSAFFFFFYFCIVSVFHFEFAQINSQQSLPFESLHCNIAETEIIFGTKESVRIAIQELQL